MKSALKKNAFVEIFKTKSRFLSIFSIVAIGIAFFAGVKNSAPDMRKSADSYYKRRDLAHFRLISTFGFSDKDIEALENIDGIQVYPGYFTDVLIGGGEQEEIARVMSMSQYGENNTVNKLELTEGHFPEKSDECIVDGGLLTTNKNIGDKISFISGNDNDISDTLSRTEYTIVGKFISPAYVDIFSKGSTTVGNGNINTLIYVNRENFKTEVYTEVYIYGDSLKKLSAYSKEFDDESAKLQSALEQVGGRREIERYDEIIAEAEKKLADAEKELADGKAEAEKKLADGKKELDDAKKQLDDSKKQLDDAKKQLDDGKAKSEQGRKDLDKGWADYNKGEQEAKDKFAAAEKELAENKQKLIDGEIAYNEGLIKYNQGLSDYNSGLEQYNSNLALYEQGYRIYSALDEFYKRLHEWENGNNGGNLTPPSYTGIDEDRGDVTLPADTGNLNGAEIEADLMLPADIEKYNAACIENYEDRGDVTLPLDINVAQDIGDIALPIDINISGDWGGITLPPEISIGGDWGGITLPPEIGTGSGWENTLPETPTPQLPPEIAALFDTLPTEEEVAAKLKELAEAKKQLDDAKVKLDDAKKQLDEADKELKDAKTEIEDGKKQLSQGEITLANEKVKAEQQLAEAAKKLADGEKAYYEGLEQLRQGEEKYQSGLTKYNEGEEKYKKGLADYEKGKKEADDKIAEGEKKIRDAKRELKELKNPSWYVFDRSGNPGYTEYGENADRINNIASVFPVFFILVAALVCLTTMTRMVEEQRSQIGTLKALGYTNGQIIFKFMFYALSATVLGSLFGAVLGQKLFPFAIIKAYGMMYSIPLGSIPTNLPLTLACMAVAAAAAALTVYLSCHTELKEQPAQLMRPKAPRAGKKILLEHLPLWKRIGFNGKVTARNLFRYKRRMLMTVVGIAGCTALTLVGFALEDSISGIINKQYGQLNSYDGILAYESIDNGDVEEIKSVLDTADCEGIKYFQKKMTLKNGKNTVSAYLIVPESRQELLRYYTFRDRKTHQTIDFEEDKILIDEKAAKLLNVKANGEVNIYLEETDIKTAVISGCVENYPNHYIYMSKELYKTLFGAEPEYNIMAFGKKSDDASFDKESENNLAQNLLATNAVLSVKFRNEMVTTMSTMLKALNSVIVILIVSAGSLAFVVLYNLTNINITERIREIATLKVMGFYDLEVDNYIFRENLILTLMGIAAGLVGGTFLALFIIQTAEIDVVMFGRDIKPFSYVISGIITLGFSIIVTLYMHRHLKKVDMIEALKSVE